VRLRQAQQSRFKARTPAGRAAMRLKGRD
jgi:hypothetical protein